jgi:hypothetical protein
MSYRDLPDELLQQVTPLEVRRYALADGWRRREGVNGTIALYQRPDSELEQLVVPLDPARDDYIRSVADVIIRLAARANLTPQRMLEDLLDSGCDLVRFRLDEQESLRGSIPLPQGISLLTSAERALLSSACSVIQPQPFHPRLSRSEAEQLVRACRMGQTERGSFTLKVACPLFAVEPESAVAPPMPLFENRSEPDSEAPSQAKNEPFTRRVTRLLMGSLSRIARAIDSDNTASLLVDQPDQPSISANLCEAILAMQPVGDRSRLAVQASWSRAYTPPAESETPAIVVLRNDVFSEIEKIAQELRPAKEPRISQFIGLVDSLSGDPGPDGRVEGDLVLMIFDVEGTIRARATLGADDYKIAWQAHGDARYVAFSGILMRERRIHRIEKISQFKLLPDS